MTREDWFKNVLAKYQRIAICGGPRTGKTTLSRLAHSKKHSVLHGDNFMTLDWSKASATLAAQANEIAGPVVIEGVAVPRALRKGMRVDCVVWLDEPLTKLNAGQEAMRKGCVTVLADWYKDHKHVPMLQAPKASSLTAKWHKDDK